MTQLSESKGSSAQTIAGVERALDVLSQFAVAETLDLGVTEIAEQLNMSKAVVHRILASCRAKGYVEMDPLTRRYRLGPSALELGLSYLNRIDPIAEVRDTLGRLCRRTNETATHSIRTGLSRVYVDQVTPLRDIKMVVQIGVRYPLHAGSSGKALLAFLPEELREAYFVGQDLLPVTDLTVTNVDRLRKEVEEIRKQGYAVSFGERQEGAGSVAAPILDRQGYAVGVISVCGPLERFRSEVDACAAALLEETSELSLRFGHRP